MHKKTKLVHDTYLQTNHRGMVGICTVDDKHADKFHLHKTAK